MRPIGLLTAAVVLLAGCGIGDPEPTPRPACPQGPLTRTEAQTVLADAHRAVIETNKGSFTVELRGDVAPLATANFVALARCAFYDEISFHRVLPGFVAQAGDPQTRQNRGDFAGLGNGGPGYQFEIERPPEELTYEQYSFSMANAGGTATNGSQFFIALEDLPQLPPDYTILGMVVEGTDTVDAIGQVPINGPRGVPLDPVIIQSIGIEAADD
jgi:cyclophilin family peptidyl-prolyl cis-trans isomerase